MKRLDLIRHLERHGCVLLREGARHSVYVRRGARKASTIPGIGKSMITSRAKSAKTSKSRKCERSLHSDQVATRLTYSLDELCKHITLENLHDLIDSGAPVGNESA